MITSFGRLSALVPKPDRASFEASSGPELVAVASACLPFFPGGTKAGRPTAGNRDEPIPRLARGFRRPGSGGAAGDRGDFDV